MSMERKRGIGKGAGRKRRAYDASGRRAQAERTRGAILEVAERIFLSEGYAGTTVAAVAAAASVSVETIYKGFNGKAGLVRALRDLRLAGRGPVHAEARSDRASHDATDAREIVAKWGRLAAEVAPMVSPILLLVRDAAITDPDMAALQVELDDDRLRRMTLNARHLQKGGHLKPGVTLRRAGDVLWTCSSPTLYELLVLSRKWSAAQYGRFVADSIAAALLP